MAGNMMCLQETDGCPHGCSHHHHQPSDARPAEVISTRPGGGVYSVDCGGTDDIDDLVRRLEVQIREQLLQEQRREGQGDLRVDQSKQVCSQASAPSAVNDLASLAALFAAKESVGAAPSLPRAHAPTRIHPPAGSTTPTLSMYGAKPEQAPRTDAGEASVQQCPLPNATTPSTDELARALLDIFLKEVEPLVRVSPAAVHPVDDYSTPENPHVHKQGMQTAVPGDTTEAPMVVGAGAELMSDSPMKFAQRNGGPLLKLAPSQGSASVGGAASYSSGSAGLCGSENGGESKISLQKIQCFKTKQCRYWLEGRCSRGNRCTYAHGNIELRNKPDLTKTKICGKWRVGQCILPAYECPYAHGADDLRLAATPGNVAAQAVAAVAPARGMTHPKTPTDMDARRSRWVAGKVRGTPDEGTPIDCCEPPMGTSSSRASTSAGIYSPGFLDVPAFGYQDSVFSGRSLEDTSSAGSRASSFPQRNHGPRGNGNNPGNWLHGLYTGGAGNRNM